MTTLNDMEALGAEVVVEDGINGPHHYVVPPARQPQPQHLQAPATRVVSRHTVSTSAQPSAPSSGTSGIASVTPTGLQLGSGLPHGAAAPNVPLTGYGNLAPPGPTAPLSGWYQPAPLPGIGQQLPWPAAYPPFGLPTVCIIPVLNWHYPLPSGFGSCPAFYEDCSLVIYTCIFN